MVQCLRMLIALKIKQVWYSAPIVSNSQALVTLGPEDATPSSDLL